MPIFAIAVGLQVLKDGTQLAEGIAQIMRIIKKVSALLSGDVEKNANEQNPQYPVLRKRCKEIQR